VLQGVVQGVLTGIGFLGGGVILRDPQHNMVRNLTTAATVWVTAALGLACAIADWRVIGLGLLFAIVLLVTEDRLDKWIARKFGEKETDRSQT
jgi:putative Mg2+ transporter-C (MgtC) family protein